jgi:hypothetical protein
MSDSPRGAEVRPYYRYIYIGAEVRPYYRYIYIYYRIQSSHLQLCRAYFNLTAINQN